MESKRFATRDRILQYLILYQEEWGYGPSVREIARAVGLSATSTVAMHLDRLEDNGLIVRERAKCRGIRATRTELPLPALS